jgi:protein SCO1
MRRSITRAFALLAAMAAVSSVAACGRDEAQPFVGYERSPVPNVAGVSLPAVEPDGSETSFTMRSESGGLLLVYFGYTSCPDVCPTTLSDVRFALSEIGDGAGRVQLAMISIDPEVDTPEILAEYVRSFVPGAIALRSVDDGELRAAADAFGAGYGSDETHGVYHTAALYAVDGDGDLILTWSFGTSAEDLLSDIERLLAQVA